jgi:hypothetical protein
MCIRFEFTKYFSKELEWKIVWDAFGSISRFHIAIEYKKKSF